jgi:DNA polymerase-3 subunit delta'
MTWDFIGNTWAVDILRRHLEAGHVRQAYLLAGPPGVGKRTLGLRFAQALTCAAPPEPAAWCGTCRACLHVPSGKFTDLHILEREEDRSRIRVDQVRQLQKQLVLSPLESRLRVALLLDVEHANEEAQNALLKTLEEPSDKVVMLLTADRAELLLPTIVSRCEVLSLRPVPVSALASALTERGVSPEAAHRWAVLANGRPGEALRLAAEPDLDAERKARLDELLGLLVADKSERFAWASEGFGRGQKESLQRRRDQATATLECWQGLWRDVLLAASGAGVPVINQDMSEAIDQMSVVITADEAAEAMLATSRTSEAIQRNADPVLALETLMLDLPHLRSAVRTGWR